MLFLKFIEVTLKNTETIILCFLLFVTKQLMKLQSLREEIFH